MSCEVYSNGANLTVQNSMGTLPAAFCPQNWQAVFNQIALSLVSSLQGNFGAFVIGANTPEAGDQDKLWFKLDSGTCEPLGWFIYFGGAWVRAIPHPLLPGTIVDYYSAALASKTDAEAAAIIEALDGGDDGGGPFWYFCDGTHGTPDLRGRARIGAGEASNGPRDGQGRQRGDYEQGESGGEEVHTMDFSELPTVTFNLPTNVVGIFAKVNDASGTSAGLGNQTDSAYEWLAEPFAAPGGVAHNNLQPYCAIYPIMRSSRMI